jgi:hypothetical protein
MNVERFTLALRVYFLTTDGRTDGLGGWQAGQGFIKHEYGQKGAFYLFIFYTSIIFRN